MEELTEICAAPEVGGNLSLSGIEQEKIRKEYFEIKINNNKLRIEINNDKILFILIAGISYYKYIKEYNYDKIKRFKFIRI